MWPNSAISAHLWGTNSVAGGSGYNASKNFHRANLARIKNMQKDLNAKKEESAQKLKRAKKKQPLKALDRKPLTELPPRGSAVKSRHADYLHGHAKTGPFVESPVNNTLHRSQSMISVGQESTNLHRTQSIVSVQQQQQQQPQQHDLIDEFQDTEILMNEEEMMTLSEADDALSREPRFNDISADERREKISEMVHDLMQIAPLIDGQAAKPAPVNLNRRQSASLSRLSRCSSIDTREKSVQTEDRRIPPKVRGSLLDIPATISVNNNSSSSNNNRRKKSQEPAEDPGVDGVQTGGDLPVVKGVGVDYVAANKESASVTGKKIRSRRKTATPKPDNGLITPQPQPPASPQKSGSTGSIPKYLLARKQKWKEEAERREREKPDPDCPQGHVRLTDEEREEKLASLRGQYDGLVRDLGYGFSVDSRSDTLSVRAKKRAMEAELTQLEEKIREYARPRVYVKIAH